MAAEPASGAGDDRGDDRIDVIRAICNGTATYNTPTLACYASHPSTVGRMAQKNSHLVDIKFPGELRTGNALVVSHGFVGYSDQRISVELSGRLWSDEYRGEQRLPSLLTEKVDRILGHERADTDSFFTPHELVRGIDLATRTGVPQEQAIYNILAA